MRIAKIVLGGGAFRQLADKRFSLAELSPRPDCPLKDLFKRVAKEISAVAGESGGLLGHTFSYPLRQTALNKASLRRWTKEIAYTVPENADINELLRQQLNYLGRPDIVPAAILNDTAAVLLAGSYQAGGAPVLGGVCGTGHNTCYYEPRQRMVINLESGNFSPSCRNEFDREIDLASARPGEQLLEKMTAGGYLARLTSAAARAAGLWDADLTTSVQLSDILQEETAPLYPLARAIIARAAALSAAEYTGIRRYLVRSGPAPDKIFLDGAIYNKMAMFRRELAAALALLNKNPPLVIGADDSSLKGAAVACALAAG
jgi:hexokinase